MAGQLVGRRSMLAGAGVLAAGAVVLPATAASASTAGGAKGLAGGWLITRRDKGSSSSVMSTVTFADGGALATADINPPTPGTALGSWEDEANQHFSSTFWTGSPNPDGSVAVVRVRPQGRWWDDHIEGSYLVDLLVKGKLVPVASGTFHGNRIEP
jgi:hypothetical protein